MLFPHLLNRKSFVTEPGELDKFFLNLLQSFLPLAMSDVGFRSLLASKPILFIQLLNVGDFRPKAHDLFSKNFKMIHSLRITVGVTSISLRIPLCRSKRVMAWLQTVQQLELATQFTRVHPSALLRVDSLFAIKHADFRPGLTR